MGFDLYGEAPSGEIIPDCNFQSDDKKTIEAYFAWQNNTPGAYFRANVWTWRPIWNFVCDVCNDVITKEDAEMGTFNDGHLIDKEKATDIGNRLHELNDTGELTDFAEKYARMIESLPDESCKTCQGTGTRKGWEGWQSEEEWVKHHGSLNHKSSDQAQVGYKWAKECKGCNACQGTGKVAPWESSYPFVPEMVVEFADFCIESGGFRIS